MNNRTMAWVLGIVVILVLIGGAYYFGTQEAEAPTKEVGGKMAAPQWTFTQMGEASDTGAPITEVAVTFAGETHTLGEETGSCFVVEESAWELLEGEISGAICYFAGSGTEYGIFTDGRGEYELRKGWLEEANVEGGGEPRGQFETVLTF